MAKEELLTITKSRYEELSILLNRNKIQEAKIEELLSELREKKQYIKELEEYIRTQPNRKTTGVSYQQLKKNYRKKFVQ